MAAHVSAWSAPAQSLLWTCRDLFYTIAASAETGLLDETLKWGQPSYLTEATKSGTTIRLAFSEKHPDHLGLYVHCQTNLVDRYRERFPDEFTYEGNRAVLIPTRAPLPKDALIHVIAMALTYHRDKRQ